MTATNENNELSGSNIARPVFLAISVLFVMYVSFLQLPTAFQWAVGALILALATIFAIFGVSMLAKKLAKS